MNALEERIGALSLVCAGLPDRRKGPLPAGAYSMADIGLSAFSLFFMGSPSFLAHQRRLAEGQAARTARRCSASPPSPPTIIPAR